MTAFTRADTSTLGRWWWTVDRWTLAAVAMLVGFGILLTVAASPSVAVRLDLDAFYFARRHFIFLPFALHFFFFTLFRVFLDLLQLLDLGLFPGGRPAALRSALFGALLAFGRLGLASLKLFRRRLGHLRANEPCHASVKWAHVTLYGHAHGLEALDEHLALYTKLLGKLVYADCLGWAFRQKS